MTRAGRIAVMATSGTLRSARFARLLQAHGGAVEVIAQACPGLADLIEEGHLDDDVLATRLDALTRPLKKAGVDTVVLGCTHYPFVSAALERALGPGVTLVDSAPAIARRTVHLLDENAVRGAGSAEGSFQVLTTGDPARVRPVIERLWGGPVEVAAVRI